MRPTLSALLLASTTILGSACIAGYDDMRTPDGTDGGSDDTTSTGRDGTCKTVEKDLSFDSDGAFTSSKDIPKSGCWDLYGTLTLDGRDITSLAGLKGLKSVDNIVVKNTSLTAFDSANNVISYGHTTIADNLKLAAIEKLEVRTLPAGAEGDRTGISLEVKGNDVLAGLGSLGTVSELDGDLNFTNNRGLLTADLSHLSTFGGGAITFANNGALTAVDLTGISSNLHDVVIRDNVKLRTFRLGHVLSVGNLAIENNDSLTDLAGFNAMTQVLGSLSIRQNEKLAALQPFNMLSGISLGVTITDNPALPTCQVRELDACVLSGAVVNVNNQAPPTTCPKFWCQP